MAQVREQIAANLLTDGLVPAMLVLIGYLGLGWMLVSDLERRIDDLLAASVLLLGAFGLLPLVAGIRRWFFGKRLPRNKGWMDFAAGLLWASILTPVVVTGGCLFYLSATEPTDGMDGLRRGIILVVSGTLAVGVGGTLGIIGYLIELWRDQWRPGLTAASALIYLIVFAGLVATG